MKFGERVGLSIQRFLNTPLYSPIIRKGNQLLSPRDLEGVPPLVDLPLPKTWMDSIYSPGMPIRPQFHAAEDEIPREIDYPVSVNATIQPRTSYGLMPFQSLTDAFENIAEIKLCVHILTREFNTFIPKLIDKERNEITKHPYKWMIETPDRVTPWSIWVTRVLQSSLVFDAGAVFRETVNNKLQGLRYVDGSTLFMLVDVHGQIPKPPFPAFAQIIKGTPFGWYTTDDIWYKPRFRRYNAPYGMSPIEMSWAWVMMVANITSFELAHYRQGNMPEGWLIGPEGWKLDQLDAFEMILNSRMASGPAERNRVRLVPHGFDYKETKKPDFPEALYERARDNIAISFGIPPTEFGKTPGAGLGGKGFTEKMESSFFRMGLNPLRQYITDMLNEIRMKEGVDDVEINLAFPDDQLDPEKLREGVLKQFAAGMVTLNEARASLGQTSIDGGDVLLVIQGGQVIIVNDVLKGKLPPPPGGDGSVPTNDNPTPEDTAAAGKIIDSGEIPQKAYSIPASEAGTAHAGEMTAPGTDANVPQTATAPIQHEFGADQIAEIAAKLKLKQDYLDQFMMGFKEEMEHAATVDNDPMKIGQIVIDHLREDPKYYTHLGGSDVGKVEKADEPQNRGAMIALMIPDATVKKIFKIYKQWPDGSEPQMGPQMHVTLAYLGDVDSILDKYELVAQCVHDIAKECNGSIVGKINGLGRFFECDKEGMNVIYANFDAPGLVDLQQKLCKKLEENGIEVMKNHGFTPHITLAYVQKNAATPEGEFPVVECRVDHLTLAWADNHTNFAFGSDEEVEKMIDDAHHRWWGTPELRKFWGDYQRLNIDLRKVYGRKILKHCGTCEEDDAYYQAPVAHADSLQWPKNGHANEVQIVAMIPEGLPPRPALWKPVSGENKKLVQYIGGDQCYREEATYILDRAMDFYLVPVAYVAVVDDEDGAVIHYVVGNRPSLDVSEYDPEWVEKAAILDYITYQTDRHEGNWLTHPDDDGRPVLIDNGLAWPSTDIPCYSPFVKAWIGKTFSDGAMNQLRLLVGDADVWSDINDLVGEDATKMAIVRANSILQQGMIPSAVEG